MNRLRSVLAISLALAFVVGGAGVATARGQADAAAVRAVTEKYHDLNAAIADGYVEFYTCTEQPGVGTMGQHYVKLSLVGDPAVDALQPEVLVYAPKRNGGLKLVAVEYVTIAQAWTDAFGSATPTVLGQDMLFRAAGNRYGLPDFYERHAWIWQGNPLGTFNDWNPDISCLGNGDNGG
ncbi:MAG TPA: hypothetical protein VL749_00830 [Patescibacteria group bacterium]|nr:hypothetical protein [Patescibacteria group bacterium]